MIDAEIVILGPDIFTKITQKTELLGRKPLAKLILFLPFFSEELIWSVLIILDEWLLRSIHPSTQKRQDKGEGWILSFFIKDFGSSVVKGKEREGRRRAFSVLNYRVGHKDAIAITMSQIHFPKIHWVTSNQHSKSYKACNCRIKLWRKDIVPFFKMFVHKLFCETFHIENVSCVIYKILKNLLFDR